LFIQGIIGMLRKLFIVVSIGFVAIVLAGPVLAILAVMVSLALVGFLLWLPFYGLWAGWMPSLAKARACWQPKYDRLWRTARSFVSDSGHEVLERVHGTVRMAVTAISEVLSGAVVVGFVVHLSQREHSFPPGAEATGALVGACLGMLVALSHWRATQKRTCGQLQESLD
jgi:hypothetical protein